MNAKNDPVGTVDDIRRDLQSLRDDISRLGGQVSSQVGASGSQTINEITQALRRMNELVAFAGERGRGLARDIASDVGRSVEGNVRSLEGNVRAHPLGAIAVAVVLGFVLGSLTRR